MPILVSKHCGRRSWRGRGSQMTLVLAIKGSLLPSLSLEGEFCPLFPQWELFSRTETWESNVLLRPSEQCMWLNPVKVSLYTFNILAGMEVYSQCSAHDKVYMQVPLLTEIATYQFGVACLFIWSLLSLCVQGPVSDFSQAIPRGKN